MTATNFQLCVDFTSKSTCEIPAHIFDLMPSGLAYCRLQYQDGKPYGLAYLYTNPAFDTLTGLEVVRNKPVSDLINSEPKLFKIFGEVAAGGVTENFEYFISSLQQWFSVQVFSPRPEYIVCIFTVINARTSVNLALNINEQHYNQHQHAEKALEKSQRDLNRAQAVAHIGSWRMDVRNDELEWSDENFRIFGIEPGTPLTYQTFLDVVHPADRNAVEAAWKFALTGEPYDIKHRIIVDKKIKWVHEQAELEYDEQNSLLGVFGTTKDITDLKRSQHALQKERMFLRQIIDAVPSVIFVKDRQGRFLLGNLALANSYHTSPKALIGLTENNFNANADEVQRFHQNDLAVLNDRIPKHFSDEKVTHADGSVHWYNVVKLPLINNKKCNKVLVVATDITENKLSREAINMANQRKDEFLAMLAHELRNPLAPIRNAVQFLNKHSSQALNLTEACQVIDRQVTHMVRLLDDLLDVARIMQDKINLKLECLNLTDIINNALETSRPLIESRRQELIISQTSMPQWIQGDRIRLAQVLSNLLNNAAKYTG